MIRHNDPHQELVRARDRFNDAMDAAEVPREHRIGLKAACEAVAKARAIVAIAELADSRRSPATDPGPN